MMLSGEPRTGGRAVAPVEQPESIPAAPVKQSEVNEDEIPF